LLALPFFNCFEGVEEVALNAEGFWSHAATGEPLECAFGDSSGIAQRHLAYQWRQLQNLELAASKPYGRTHAHTSGIVLDLWSNEGFPDV
jgi:hypothetical protein